MNIQWTLAALLSAGLAIASSVQAQPLQAISPEDLVLQLQRDKKGGGSRGAEDAPLDSRACTITPGLPIETDLDSDVDEKIWSLEPLFLWRLQNTVIDRIELNRLSDGAMIWRYEPDPDDTSILYNGEPLEPGQAYLWELFLIEPEIGQTVASIDDVDLATFEVIPAEQREQIARDLAALEARLKAADASPEAAALERASYFAEQDLWSDAVRELYSVEDPSPELQAARAQVRADDGFCQFM